MQLNQHACLHYVTQTLPRKCCVASLASPYSSLAAGQICIGLEIILFQMSWCLLLISVMHACGQLAVHVHAATLTLGKQ